VLLYSRVESKLTKINDESTHPQIRLDLCMDENYKKSEFPDESRNEPYLISECVRNKLKKQQKKYHIFDV